MSSKNKNKVRKNNYKSPSRSGADRPSIEEITRNAQRSADAHMPAKAANTKASSSKSAKNSGGKSGSNSGNRSGSKSNGNAGNRSGGNSNLYNEKPKGFASDRDKVTKIARIVALVLCGAMVITTFVTWGIGLMM